MKTLLNIADIIDGFNHRLGKALSVLVIILILVQFALIVMSANFKTGSIMMQESLLYINSLMFLGAAGFTLLRDRHVRVDIFYREASNQQKARTNFYGTLLLLFPFMIFLWVIGLPYVISSWSNFEASFETSGLPIVYILKSFILLFAFSLSIQGMSLAIRSFFAMKDKG